MPELCNDLKPRYDCFADRAVECKMGLAKDANQVKQIIAETCTEGTILNKLVKKEKKCFQDAFMDQKCSDPIVAVLNGASNFKEIVLKNKEACKLLEFYSECIVERVVHYCGPNSKDLFSYLFDRLFKLGRSMCNDVILPADENDESFGNLGQLDAFNFIIPFFMYP
ncbi:uncharacterized protein LOC129969454 isoform X2 [Argiope bruennichi]|nr:uncharacterized protein LOC129969454 isoform X2 [Argiope bruennichi]